jgi:hypothetical protein
MALTRHPKACIFASEKSMLGPNGKVGKYKISKLLFLYFYIHN